MRVAPAAFALAATRSRARIAHRATRADAAAVVVARQSVILATARVRL